MDKVKKDFLNLVGEWHKVSRIEYEDAVDDEGMIYDLVEFANDNETYYKYLYNMVDRIKNDRCLFDPYPHLNDMIVEFIKNRHHGKLYSRKH